MLLFFRAFVLLKFYAQLFSVPYKYFCTSGCATNRGDAKYSGRMDKTDKIGKLVKKQTGGNNKKTETDVLLKGFAARGYK